MGAGAWDRDPAAAAAGPSCSAQRATHVRRRPRGAGTPRRWTLPARPPLATGQRSHRGAAARNEPRLIDRKRLGAKGKARGGADPGSRLWRPHRAEPSRRTFHEACSLGKKSLQNKTKLKAWASPDPRELQTRERRPPAQAERRQGSVGRGQVRGFGLREPRPRPARGRCERQARSLGSGPEGPRGPLRGLDYTPQPASHSFPCLIKSGTVYGA